MSKLSLSDLRVFIAVARAQSFRAAADAIGVSRSALSHSVRGLEEDLGVRLLHRTTRSVALTEAGERLLKRLSPTLGELDSMISDVRGQKDSPTGALRINAPESGIRWMLRHAVPEFLARFPGIKLDLVSEGRLIDIVSEGFDAGVRLRESVPQDMVFVPFGGTLRFIAVASRAYLAKNGEPATPDDLRKHACIRQRLPSGKPYRWEFARNGTEIAIDVPGQLTLDHNSLMVEATEDGLGIAFVPESYARDAIGRGSIVAVLEAWSPHEPGLCLYYPGHRLVPPTLRLFVDHLKTIDLPPP